MFRIDSEQDLLDSFRPSDRSTVTLPENVKYPLFVRDYLAWTEPAGVRAFLVYADPDSRSKTLGIAFRSDQSRAPVAQHCEWCKSFGGSNDIGLLTAEASDRKRVGIHLCRGLNCHEKLETRSHLSGENSRMLNRQLIARISTFARRHLF